MSYPFSYLICQLRREYTSTLQTRLDAFGLTVGLFPYLIYLEHTGACTPSAMARKPVSYTHLDVYKRQPLSPRRLSA